jgi:2-polyprenyl-3-methyl-5-hydroxy-6-metoxy-1,4-benzoquinol methylase
MAMETSERQKHWETIYETRQLSEVSWYQVVPQTSLDFINESTRKKNAAIIDVGGGDSFLVDHLLHQGYTNITVLDVSEKALHRAKNRLGNKARLVKWIVADAAHFTPPQKYDVWHDRAAFHFLTDDTEILNYVSAVKSGLQESGTFIVGTFSESGPKKCSGIEIRQYSEESLTAKFAGHFEKIRCIRTGHLTPFNTRQDFVFCSFRKT